MQPKETSLIVPSPASLIDQTVQAARMTQSLSGNDKSGVGAVLWQTGPQGSYKGVSVSANGFPVGLSRHNIRYKNGYFSDFDLHAESGAIAKSAREGRATLGATCTTTHCPCFECTKMLIEAGISRVVIDGAQKLRPNWYNKWLPMGQQTLGMLERAGISVVVEDLRLNEQGEPDIRMTSEESNGPPFRRYALSASQRKVASAEEGTALYRQAVLAQPSPGEPEADAWLKIPAFVGNNLTGLALPVQRAAHGALSALAKQKKHHPHYPDHAAVVFDEKNPRLPNLIETSRPPKGCEEQTQTADGTLAWSMHPEMLAVAHAARDGRSLEGKSVYLTHAPTNRGAVMLAGAKVGKVYIDSRSLPKELKSDVADRLWKGFVAMKEAGIEVKFLFTERGHDPVEHIYSRVSPEVREDIRIMATAPTPDWKERLASRAQKFAENSL